MPVPIVAAAVAGLWTAGRWAATRAIPSLINAARWAISKPVVGKGLLGAGRGLSGWRLLGLGTAAHIASDGESTDVIYDGVELVSKATASTIKSTDPEVAAALADGAGKITQETLVAWSEMGAEGTKRLAALGIEFAENTESGKKVFSFISGLRNPLFAAIKEVSSDTGLEEKFNNKSAMEVAAQAVEEEKKQEQKLAITMAATTGVGSAISGTVASRFASAVEAVESGSAHLDFMDRLKFKFFAAASRAFSGIPFIGELFQEMAFDILHDEVVNQGQNMAGVTDTQSFTPPGYVPGGPAFGMG